MTDRVTDTGFRPGETAEERELRARAVKRLEDKRGLMAHSLAFFSVNLLLVGAVFVALAAGAHLLDPKLPGGRSPDRPPA